MADRGTISDTDALYDARFSEAETRAKDLVWRELTRYFQRYVDSELPVLDVACDRGYFIRNIRANEKWATDVRDLSAYLPSDVHFVLADGLALPEKLPLSYFGIVFMSNYLEHLPSSEAVVQQLRVAFQLLRDGGKVIILQPNIRLVGDAYWDFIDHKTPLTEKSLREAADMAGFRVHTEITRFLPYTSKSALPKSPTLVRWYLSLKYTWRYFGKQSLYVGERVPAKSRIAETREQKESGS
jgi:SAM-dependent methyltransferase